MRMRGTEVPLFSSADADWRYVGSLRMEYDAGVRVAVS